jgi:hypothetical protein
MPFHVELRQGYRRASAFNLDEETLRRTVLEPWQQGGSVELGDKEWDPQESTLQILEGPELAAPDLAVGRGWHNAERSAQDATARLLERIAAQAASVAVVAQTPATRRVVIELLEQAGVRAADWEALRARILAAATIVGEPSRSLEAGAAVLVIEGPDPDQSWLFDAGLALGALGGRAIVVQLGNEPAPAQLRDLRVIRLDPAQPASMHALIERLRHAVGRIGTTTA